MKTYEVKNKEEKQFSEEQLELNAVLIHTYMLSGFSMEHTGWKKTKKRYQTA